MKRFMAMTILMMLFLPITTVIAAGPTVSISPARTKVAVGETVSVDIAMQNLPRTEGGGVSLYFNPSVVKVTGVTVNADLWEFKSSGGTIDNTNGKVSDIWFSSFRGAAGDGTIATIELEAIKPGRTRLKLHESSISPFASGGQKLLLHLKNGVIKVKRVKHKK